MKHTGAIPTKIKVLTRNWHQHHLNINVCAVLVLAPQTIAEGKQPKDMWQVSDAKLARSTFRLLFQLLNLSSVGGVFVLYSSDLWMFQQKSEELRKAVREIDSANLKLLPSAIAEDVQNCLQVRSHIWRVDSFNQKKAHMLQKLPTWL